MSTWLSGRLVQLHDLSQFDCGVVALDQWLSGQARDAQVRGTAATYVWTAAGPGHHPARPRPRR